MSHEAVQAVLERTLSDEAFRARLFSEPATALATYDLTADEAQALRSLTVDSSTGDSGQLDERQSKRPLWTEFF